MFGAFGARFLGLSRLGPTFGAMTRMDVDAFDTVMVTGLGTPYEIDTSGSVLFIEDVAERPYRIDRMMTHLKQAGKLDDLAGVVLGPMVDCDGGEGSAILRDIVLEALEGTACPVAFGIDAGHGSANAILPFGCEVEIDTGQGCVNLLESPFQ